MDWLAELLAALDAAQRSLLALLAALGGAGEVHGQPAWPFAQRIAIEVLAIDRAMARSLLVSLVLAALAVAALLLGALWQRARWPAWSVAAAGLLLAPWPSPSLLFAPAVPSSFHRSPTGFSAEAIARGERLYRTHCVSCHGEDGRGDGPSAAPRAGSPAIWPPDLTGALLWRRADGELLWHVLHGVHDHRQRLTMPGFADRLDAVDAWALLDFLQAQAAGQTLRRGGVWAQPIRPPDALVSCEDGRTRPLRAWSGQRLRIVAPDGQPGQGVREDPRFDTVVLGGAGERAACVIADPLAWQAFARLAGVDGAQLAGMQFLVDRRGWLRARSAAGKGDWSAADLVCRADVPAAASASTAGLDTLIARMEAEPVRFVKGGVPH